MLGLFGFNIIEKKLIVFNCYQLLYEIKYNGKSGIMKKAERISKRRQASELFLILSIIKDGKIPETQGLSDKKMAILFQSVKVLVNQGMLSGKFKAHFSKEGIISKLELDSLKITEKGISAYNQSIKNTDFDFNLLESVWDWLFDYVQNIDLKDVKKEVMIKKIQEKVSISGYDILEFGIPKPTQDLVFDHHMGKITINNFEHLQMFLSKQNKRNVENTIHKFLNNTIHTMTEMKLILKGISDQDMAFISFFMTDQRLMTLLLYMVDHEYIKLDVSYEEKQNMNIRIHYVALTEKGLNYLKDPTLIKLKNKPMMINVILAALRNVNKGKVKKENPLSEMVASEYLQ